MPFKSDGSYYQVPGRAAVFATAGEVDNISDLPRCYPVSKLRDENVERRDNFKWPQVPVRMSRMSDPEVVQARQLMRKKSAPDERGYRYSLGYNKAVGYYSAGFQAFRFSGSSYNRKFSKEYEQSQEKELYRQAIIAGQVAKEESRFDIERQLKYDREIMELRIATHGSEDTQVGEGGADRDTCSVCGSSLSDCLCYLQAPKYHVLSDRTKAKIKDKATAFFRACPYRRCFVTLTFIDAIQDKAAVTVLNKFLTQLKKKYRDLQYLWVAERQNKNEKFPGNIHFHIIINRRLSIDKYNALWVLEQYNSGLRGTNKYGEIISEQEITERYRDGTIKKVFNPFDIKTIRSIDNLSWYLTKYITKGNAGEDKRGFRCAAWHCSRGVSRLFTRTLVGPSCFRAAMSGKNFSVNKLTGECFYPRLIKKQFWLMVYINNKSFPLQYLKELEQVNKWLIRGERLFERWQDMPVVDDDSYNHFFISEN